MLKKLWEKWKVTISFVGGALVVASTYGTCTVAPDKEAISQEIVKDKSEDKVSEKKEDPADEKKEDVSSEDKKEEQPKEEQPKEEAE